MKLNHVFLWSCNIIFKSVFWFLLKEKSMQLKHNKSLLKLYEVGNSHKFIYIEMWWKFHATSNNKCIYLIRNGIFILWCKIYHKLTPDFALSLSKVFDTIRFKPIPYFTKITDHKYITTAYFLIQCVGKAFSFLIINNFKCWWVKIFFYTLKYNAYFRQQWKHVNNCWESYSNL